MSDSHQKVLESTGEDLNLSRSSRLELIRETVAAVDKRIPVLAGTGQNNYND